MYVKIQVVIQSENESIIKNSPDAFVAHIREKAEAGLANKRLIELLRAYLGAGKRIRIISGHHSTHKIIAVD